MSEAQRVEPEAVDMKNENVVVPKENMDNAGQLEKALAKEMKAKFEKLDIAA